MAKVKNNMLIRGLTGTLGNQFIVKTDKTGRTIVANKTNFDGDHDYTLAQLAHQQDFREAVAYANKAKVQEIYVRKADGEPQSPFNVAVADWFNRPQILEVNLTGWHGAAGEAIRMRVQDDVKVVSVSVTLSDEDGAVLEEGQASEGDALWWEYPTTSALSGKLTVTISAKDLPGHTAEYSQVRTLSGS